MALPKSPFIVHRDFLSPKICEDIVCALGFYTPDFNKEGKPIKMVREHEDAESIIFEKFQLIIPTLEQYYGFNHRGTEPISFEYYAEGVESQPQSENSNMVNKKWARTKDRDLSCVLFLCDYQDNVPFDNDYEVYGGKLEFLTHQFGFNPQRGTLIVYPSGPNFVNIVSPIFVGDSIMARFHIASMLPYVYNPNNFPGNYTNWFKGLF